ncbi:zinc finger BED domain-containing protein RICESLEEPER 2-like protein [Tanacetum coccineum]
MHATISRMCKHTDERKEKMVLSMKDKYEKYWDNFDNMNFLLHVALVLDPHNKLYYLKYCLGLIYGEPEESEEEMFESDYDDLSKRGHVVKRVKSTLTELYKRYKMKTDKEKDQNTPVASSSTPTYGASRLKVDIESGFGKLVETKLEKFRILSQVARHVLTMPISTDASESAFSTSGRVIDKFRSSLTPKTVKALIFTQDWLRSTPADVEDVQVNDQQFEDLVENLAKIELSTEVEAEKRMEVLAALRNIDHIHNQSLCLSAYVSNADDAILQGSECRVIQAAAQLGCLVLKVFLEFPFFFYYLGTRVGKDQ